MSNCGLCGEMEWKCECCPVCESIKTDMKNSLTRAKRWKEAAKMYRKFWIIASEEIDAHAETMKKEFGPALKKKVKFMFDAGTVYPEVE